MQQSLAKVIVRCPGAAAPTRPSLDDHVVEVMHHLGLGHHRQPGEVGELERRRVDPRESASVEW